MKNILPEHPHWLDRRLLNVNHNEFARRVTIPETVSEWTEQRNATRSKVALAAGLIPMPDFPTLKPHVWDQTDFHGVTIAKVEFQSAPGLVCTGNLYTPTNVRGKIPAILCPHGHWIRARLQDHETNSTPKLCTMLAKLGFAVFCYDMLGYSDNNQISHHLPLDLLRTAELYGVEPFALQTWNSLRALDFLSELPFVDSQKIGCTGASGGASQAWTLAVLDERIKVLAPVCMLSAHYQGGCICEEGALLRLNGLTSFDILAACAPKPLIIPSVTQDWTNLNPTYELPALKQIYKLLGAPKHVRNIHADAPHNFGQFTREHVYPWLVHFLQGKPLQNSIPETGDLMPPRELLQLHPDEPAPTQESTREHLTILQNFTAKDALGYTLEKKDFLGEKEEKIDVLSFVINNDTELADIAVRVTCPQWDEPYLDAHVQGLLVSRRDEGDVIPALKISTLVPNQSQKACLLLSLDGKNAFLQDEQLKPVVKTLLQKRFTAFAIDTIGTGETADMPGKSPRDERDPTFFAFNPSLFSLRVQDILTTLAMIAEAGFQSISVLAIGDAARLAACAVPLAERIQCTILDLKDITDRQEDWLQPQNFQPLILKIGGLKGILPLVAPQNMILNAPEQELIDIIQPLYQSLDRKSALKLGNSTLAHVLETAL